MDCFVANAPLRKRFAFVAGNDEENNDGEKLRRYCPGFGGADNCSVRSRSVMSMTVCIGAVSS
jgi:hypothetical protein